MSFVKIVKSKKDNQVQRYAYLVEIVDGEEEIAKKFGAVTKDQAEKLKISFSSSLTAKELKGKGKIEYGPTNPIGDVALLESVWHKLGLSKCIDQYFSTRFKIPGSSMLKLLAFQRLLAPYYSKGVIDWYRQISGLRYILDIDEDDLTEKKIENSLVHFSEIYESFYKDFSSKIIQKNKRKEQITFFFTPMYPVTYYKSGNVGIHSKLGEHENADVVNIILELVIDSFGNIVGVHMDDTGQHNSKPLLDLRKFDSYESNPILICDEMKVSKATLDKIRMSNYAYMIKRDSKNIEDLDLKNMLKNQRNDKNESFKVLKKVQYNKFTLITSYVAPSATDLVIEASSSVSPIPSDESSDLHNVWDNVTQNFQKIRPYLESIREEPEFIKGDIFVSLVAYQLANFINNVLSRYRGQTMNELEDVLPHLRNVTVAPIYSGGEKIKNSLSQMTAYQINTLKYFSVGRQKIENIIAEKYNINSK